MSESNKPAIVTTGAVSILVIIGTLIGVFTNRDDEKPAVPPSTQTHTMPAEDPPVIETAPPVIEPEPQPEPIVDVPDELSLMAGRVRPSRPEATCTQDEITRAAQLFRGVYAHLAGRCDLIGAWQLDGGDIVVWLARNGYVSPLAVCPRRFVAKMALLPHRPDGRRYDPVDWDTVTLRVGDVNKNVPISPSSWRESVLDFTVDFPCTESVMKAGDTFLDEWGVRGRPTLNESGYDVKLVGYRIEDGMHDPHVTCDVLPIPARRFQ